MVVLLKAGFLGKDGTRMEPSDVLMLAMVKEAEGLRIKAGQLSKPRQTSMLPSRAILAILQNCGVVQRHTTRGECNGGLDRQPSNLGLPR